jgi:transcriptional regulator with XRE-family HTH domain
MDSVKIGQYIRIQRKAVGLTLQQLAARLKASFRAMSKWENADAAVYMSGDEQSTGRKLSDLA